MPQAPFLRLKDKGRYYIFKNVCLAGLLAMAQWLDSVYHYTHKEITDTLKLPLTDAAVIAWLQSLIASGRSVIISETDEIIESMIVDELQPKIKRKKIRRKKIADN